MNRSRSGRQEQESLVQSLVSYHLTFISYVQLIIRSITTLNCRTGAPATDLNVTKRLINVESVAGAPVLQLSYIGDTSNAKEGNVQCQMRIDQ